LCRTWVPAWQARDQEADSFSPERYMGKKKKKSKLAKKMKKLNKKMMKLQKKTTKLQKKMKKAGERGTKVDRSDVSLV
jgi:hypothetical protein